MKKNRKVLNTVMAAAIAAVVLSGVMIVGNIKGWFDFGGTSKSSQSAAYTVAQKSGGANIKRDGVSYALEVGTKLRSGDVLETLTGGQLTITDGNNKVLCSQNSRASIQIDEHSGLTVQIQNGEAFFDVLRSLRADAAGTVVSSQNSTFFVSAPCGSTNLYIFGGSVKVGNDTYGSQTAVSIIQKRIAKSKLSVNALNDFCITCLRQVNSEKRPSCFTNAQLTALTASRSEEKTASLESKLQQETSTGIPDEKTAEKTSEAESKSTKQGGTIPETKTPSIKSQQPAVEEKGSASAASNRSAASSTAQTCTIEIRCDTILNNKKDLKAGKNAYVPADGTILSPVRVNFKDSETVFDVLKRVTTLTDIQLEYAWTPMYNSYYIEGINNLYEFDCGNQSGWMYKVNGWFPNYGCSSYKLKAGDKIIWCYTCKGLGADVGGSVQ